jgi:type 1 fimbriae regulatory protein FimB/type 1 fimbriae regulatory protein FimE
MYRHGLRISEAVAVTWDDVQLGRAGSIYIARRKGSQSGTHTLDTDELRMLREVQREQERNGRESRFVFVSKRRTPLAVRTAREFITDAARAAGLPVTNPHALRHAAGARLINKGYDVRHVQQYLGHKDIRNTAKYTELSPHALAGMERD